jgi:hypothetical protein
MKRFVSESLASAIFDADTKAELLGDELFREQTLRFGARVFQVSRPHLAKDSPVLWRLFGYDGPSRLQDVVLEIEAPEGAVATYIAYVHRDPYAITAATWPELYFLSELLKSKTFTRALDAYMSDPAHEHGLLLPTIESALLHSRPTAALEAPGGPPGQLSGRRAAAAPAAPAAGPRFRAATGRPRGGAPRAL